MTTLTINIPDGTKSKLAKFMKEIGGEIVAENAGSTNQSATKKARLLNEIQAGLKEVKAIRDGKLKSYTMEDLLNDK